ncbi:hypothetical protein [Rothia koreensis]|jgi:hypothetical protein|uniref:hypothetical protein n=1 Tax=Rothia koreensis TaxID=592378 RepID=UPI0010113E95|nr:hypothetical protein [Rothia koreensis]
MPVDDCVTHHLLKRPGDLLPYCGTWPGRDPETGEFHSVHVLDTLLEVVNLGLDCCATCLSPDALGGWSPMALEEEP